MQSATLVRFPALLQVYGSLNVAATNVRDTVSKHKGNGDD